MTVGKTCLALAFEVLKHMNWPFIFQNSSQNTRRLLNDLKHYFHVFHLGSVQSIIPNMQSFIYATKEQQSHPKTVYTHV